VKKPQENAPIMPLKSENSSNS